MNYIKVFIIFALLSFMVSLYLAGKSHGRRAVLEDIMTSRLQAIDDKADIDIAVKGMTDEELFNRAARFVNQ